MLEDSAKCLHYYQEPGRWKRDCHKFKHFRCSQPSNETSHQLSQGPPKGWGSKELPRLFPILSLNWLGEVSLQIGKETIYILDTGATLSMLNPTVKKSLPHSNKTVQIVGISNTPQQVNLSEPIPFCLDPLKDTHCFLLSSSALSYLLD